MCDLVYMHDYYEQDPDVHEIKSGKSVIPFSIVYDTSPDDISVCRKKYNTPTHTTCKPNASGADHQLPTKNPPRNNTTNLSKIMKHNEI